MIAAMSTGAATFAPSIQPLPNAEASGLLSEALETQRQSEQLFRAVFDTLPVGLWIADREGNITDVNPAGRSIWQGAHYDAAAPEHEVKGWWLETGSLLAADEWGISRAIDKGEASPRKLMRIQCLDGSSKTVINWATPIRSHTGAVVGAVAVNEDVTALHHAQEQLRKAVRDREDILAVVTHDLRSPLSAIRILAATVELKACGDARGAGLGLSICRSIVESHGGRIWAESVPGKRVRICFYLPSACPAAATPPATCAIA